MGQAILMPVMPMADDIFATAFDTEYVGIDIDDVTCSERFQQSP